MSFILQHMELIFNIASKDLKERYRQSYLRCAWVIIKPLLMMVAMMVVFSRLAKIPSEGVPYPIFNLTALIPWTILSTSLIATTNCLVDNRSLITKIYFPRISLVIGAIGFSLVNFFVSFIIFLIICLFFGINLGLKLIFVLPLLFIQIILIIGIGCILSISNAYIRDIQNAIPTLSHIWMLLSPIAYPIEIIPTKYYWLYFLNPMSALLDSYRKVLIHNKWPEWHFLGIAVIISLIILLFGLWFFKKNEFVVADVV